jgi:hypothetical protein
VQAQAFYDAKLTENYCGFTDDNGNPVTDCPDPEAPDGTQLPVTPKFKGNLIARYNFNIGSFDSFVQGAVVHVGDRKSDLRLLERSILGDLPAVHHGGPFRGISKNSWSLSVYVNNVFRRARPTSTGSRTAPRPSAVQRASYRSIPTARSIPSPTSRAPSACASRRSSEARAPQGGPAAALGEAAAGFFCGMRGLLPQGDSSFAFAGAARAQPGVREH